MEDLKEPATAQNSPATPPASPKRAGRTAFKALLYVLATVGLLVLAIVGYAIFEQHRNPPRERLTIDEAAMIDSLMSSNYGKYSAARKGWVYVDESDTTYVMRVIQHVRLKDRPEGDELYMVVSGQSNDPMPSIYGLFHVRPGTGQDAGKLVEISKPFEAGPISPIEAADVRFEALSDNLWGWVIKLGGYGRNESHWDVYNHVFAPHGSDIAELGVFLASSDETPDVDCATARARYEEYLKQDDPVEDAPNRCDRRTWSYSTATVNGSIPVALTVTAGGSFDGQPVEPKKYKLVFDNKRFSYNVPAELQ